jgi:hypothetical protein
LATFTTSKEDSASDASDALLFSIGRKEVEALSSGGVGEARAAFARRLLPSAPSAAEVAMVG